MRLSFLTRDERLMLTGVAIGLFGGVLLVLSLQWAAAI